MTYFRTHKDSSVLFKCYKVVLGLVLECLLRLAWSLEHALSIKPLTFWNFTSFTICFVSAICVSVFTPLPSCCLIACSLFTLCWILCSQYFNLLCLCWYDFYLLCDACSEPPSCKLDFLNLDHASPTLCYICMFSCPIQSLCGYYPRQCSGTFRRFQSPDWIS